MDQETFIEKMKDLLDQEELTMDSDLEEIEEWDSLAFVTFLAMTNQVAKRRVAPKEIKTAKTVGDLFKLLN